MKRRRFIQALGLAPAVPLVARIPAPGVCPEPTDDPASIDRSTAPTDLFIGPENSSLPLIGDFWVNSASREAWVYTGGVWEPL